MDMFKELKCELHFEKPVQVLMGKRRLD